MKLQVIELSLADGRKVSALVPAFMEAGDVPLAIDGIKAFPPFEDPGIQAAVVDKDGIRPVSPSGGNDGQ